MHFLKPIAWKDMEGYEHTFESEEAFYRLMTAPSFLHYLSPKSLIDFISDVGIAITTAELNTFSDDVMAVIVKNSSFLPIEITVNQWPKTYYVGMMLLNQSPIHTSLTITDFMEQVTTKNFFRFGYEVFCKIFQIEAIEHFDSDFFTGYDELIYLLPYYYAMRHGDASLQEQTKKTMLSFVREQNTWWSMGHLLSAFDINPLKNDVTQAEWHTLWCSLVLDPHYRQCDIHDVVLDDPVLFNVILKDLLLSNELPDIDSTTLPSEVEEIVYTLVPKDVCFTEVSMSF